MVNYSGVGTEQDLAGILALQARNLPGYISPEEALEQGFLTVVHTLDLLREMNRPHPHTVAKVGHEVVGYALTMTEDFKNQIPVLIPFFARLRDLEWQGQSITNYTYVLMGQVCVAKAYRGKGVFGGLYRTMQERMAPFFDLIVTEISERNTRSLRAHAKVGFTEISRYRAPDGEPWVIVGLACTRQ